MMVGGYGLLDEDDVKKLIDLINSLGKKHNFKQGETATYWCLVYALNSMFEEKTTNE